MDFEATQSTRPIITLPQEVVNKIAAGEVVVRPLNAVKELVENSLDAGATEVTVTCKTGGLDMIKVKDNGCGINQADYERVCQRFATSKLRTAADLQKVSTFGFRGEALASISCMAKVKVVSRTKDSLVAWTANYKNCKPIGKTTPSAGSFGTQIIAEKLFEEYPQRRSVFSRPNDEATGIANVLVKYAINFPNVKISFAREDGTNRSSGTFSSTGNGDQHAVIRLLMPSNLTKNLFDFEVEDEKYKFSAKICMASPLSSHTSTAINAKNQKQKIFQLFINNRLVTSNKLKQGVDRTFSNNDAYCPFIHINMQIEPSRIDVNVHPTKEIVCFLDEKQIIECIESKLFEIMQNFRQHGIIEMNNISNTSTIKSTPNISHKTIVMHQQNPTTSKSPELSPINSQPKKTLGMKRRLDNPQGSKSTIKIPNLIAENYVPTMAQAYAKTLQTTPSSTVRVDARNRSMNEYLTPNTSVQNASYNSLPPGEVSFYEEVLDDATMNGSINASMLSMTDYESDTSSLNLTLGEISDYGRYVFKALDEVKKTTSTHLTELVRNFVFVGFVDVTHAVFQSGNRIYLVEYISFIEEIFYQIYLRSIGKLRGRHLKLDTNKFRNGVPFNSLIAKYVSLDQKAQLPNENKFKNKDDAIDAAMNVLAEPENLRRLKAEFGVSVGTDEVLGPILISITIQSDKYTPLLSEQLSRFGYDLACVSWKEPEIATKQIARSIARLCTPHQIDKLSEDTAIEQLEMVKCYLFGLMKTDFQVPERLTPCIRNLLSTNDAYKIFGRC